MPELLGIPAEKVYDERLYRALDKLLPHKEALEKHLKDRLGSMFDLKYDLLLYDVTSTYFEGECLGNSMPQIGYSRDKRSECKQVCIVLVVSNVVCLWDMKFSRAIKATLKPGKTLSRKWKLITAKLTVYGAGIAA